MKTWVRTEEKYGWLKDAIGWWYRNKDGSYPKSKWLLVNHHWYLFGASGYICTGWHRWNGSEVDAEDGSGDWYFLDNTKDGSLEGPAGIRRKTAHRKSGMLRKKRSLRRRRML